MHIYICRNGDLGFTFDRPFRTGGSSRFLTITFLLVPKDLSHLPKRIVRKMYLKKNMGGHAQLKCAQLTQADKTYFATKAGAFLDRHPEIRIFSVTIAKETIKDHVQGNRGWIYNHVGSLALSDRIKNASQATVISDKRSIKAEKNVCLADYLQTELWFNLDSETVVKNRPQEGMKVLDLSFAGWIGHIIWSKYEDNDSEAYDLLKTRIEITPWWETLAGMWQDR